MAFRFLNFASHQKFALKETGTLIWRRTFSDTKFKSILGDSKVSSPFEDPTRIRVVQRSITSILPPVIESSSNTLRPEISQSVSFSSTVTKEEPPVIKEKEVKHETVLEPESKPLSAIEELNMLKETLNKSSSGGGDEPPKSEEDINREKEAEKRRLRLEKNTRLGSIVVFGGGLVGLITFCLYYGRAKRDDAGNVIRDEFTGSIFAPFYRIMNSINEWRDYVIEPARETLLPDPIPPPYLQPKYTLVIEMKNVLVSPEWTYKTGYRFVKRPALDYFLDVVGYPNFEVVIYTSESMMTANAVIDSMDPKQRIMFRLFRDCTKYMNGHHVKDLSKLNRDLSKVIFIEFDPKSSQLNPENMLRVPEWKGNSDDTALVDLAELLKTIHLNDVEDVRPMLQYYSQFDDPAKEFRRRAIYLAEQEEKKKFEQEQGEQSMLKRYSGRLFGYRRHASA